MRLKVILNRIEKHSAFVYERARLVEEATGPVIEIVVRPRAHSRAVCSHCAGRAPGYDTLAGRRFEYVPLWGLRVFLVYTMRRVHCPQCGIVVEAVPWAVGKHQLTWSYAWFLARWAKRLSWAEVATIFHSSWSSVLRAVQTAVEWGRARVQLDELQAIGMDEVQWQRGHKYLTVVYEISHECRRLLWVGREREETTAQAFFAWLGAERSAGLKFICSDMWKPYLKVIADKARGAVHVFAVRRSRLYNYITVSSTPLVSAKQLWYQNPDVSGREHFRNDCHEPVGCLDNADEFEDWIRPHEPRYAYARLSLQRRSAGRAGARLCSAWARETPAMLDRRFVRAVYTVRLRVPGGGRGF